MGNFSHILYSKTHAILLWMGYKYASYMFVSSFLKRITSKQIKRWVKALTIQNHGSLRFNMFITNSKIIMLF